MTKARNRANGEGTIYKRTRNGATKWYAELIVNWGTPQQKKLSSPGMASRKAADEWLTSKKQARADGTLTTPDKQTVSAYLGDWLDKVAAHQVKERTLHDYRYVIARYVDPEIGAVELQKLGPLHVQGIYHNMLEAGLSPSTVHQVHAILRCALQQAVEWFMIARNPVDAVKKPRKERQEMKTLTPAQVTNLLDTTAKAWHLSNAFRPRQDRPGQKAETPTDSRLHTFCLLALTTGMRMGELLGLRWCDVDMEARKVHVRQVLNKMGAKLIFGTPKTDQSKRQIPIHTASITALKRLHREQNAIRLRMGARWEGMDLVFTGETGGPLNPSNLRKWFFEALDGAGIPRIRIHDLRHTAATSMRDKGIDVEVVQKMLGHSDITTTLRFYVHPEDQKKREAAERMDALVTTSDRQAR